MMGGTLEYTIDGMIPALAACNQLPYTKHHRELLETIGFVLENMRLLDERACAMLSADMLEHASIGANYGNYELTESGRKLGKSVVDLITGPVGVDKLIAAGFLRKVL